MSLATSISGGGGGGGVSSSGAGGVSTDNALVRWDGTTAAGIQNSAVTLSDVSGASVTMTTTAGTALVLSVTDAAAAAGASQAGKNLSITASNAVASTDTAGAATGGDVVVTAGNAARNTSGNANGGDVALIPGTGIGTGVRGVVQFGGTSSSFVGARADAAGALVFVAADNSGSGYFFVAPSLAGAANNAGAQKLRIDATTPAYKVASDAQFTFGNGTDTASATYDVGLARDSAGVVRVSNASSGTGNLTCGRYLGRQGSDVTAANDITLGTGNYFDITGATQINTIASTGWSAGSFVTLQFDSNPTVKNATAGTGAQLALAGGDFSASAGDTLSLVYDGTVWREVARAVI